jgi:hypothetical protein
MSISLSGSLLLTGSIVASGNLTTTGTITAQTLVVQTITSSIVNITGSNIFGSQLSDRQTFTGSVLITGSLIVNTTGPELQVNNNGVSLGNLLTDNHSVTGSFRVTGSIIQSGVNTTSSFTGNVGIGTTTPSSKLEVNVGLNSLKISGRDTYIDSTEDATNANIYVTQAGAGDFSQLAGNLVLQARTQGTVYRDIIFAGGLTNGDALMTILGEGNVGIGTTSPSQKLEVVGGEIKAGRVDSSNEGGQLSFGRASDNNTAWYIDAYGNAASPQLRFVNVDNAVVAMTITGSNVGIGTSSPSYKFEVNGISASTSGFLVSSGQYTSISGVPYIGMFATEAGSSDGFGALLISSRTDAARPIIFGTSNGSVSTERMRITSGGNVELSTGSLKTGNPSGGTASAFKVGTITNGVLAPNAYVRMEINGTVVNVLINY